jgi:hypothetical protein
VIAAIQSLGNRGWGSARIPEFVRNIEGIEDLTLGRARVEPSRASIDTWAELFREHPEFFKLYTVGENVTVALVWRHVLSINYDPCSGEVLPPDRLAAIVRNENFYNTYTRKPLTSEQVEVLINTAIEMHGRAIAQQQSRFLLLPIFTALLTTIGGFLGAYLGKK